MKCRRVHFASPVDICHLKNAELETKHQKFQGRIGFGGDIVKDDSGSYAVFKEQGSSASQLTAAKVMDIISRLPGCSGQAQTQYQLVPRLKMEDATRIFFSCARGSRLKMRELYCALSFEVVPSLPCFVVLSLVHFSPHLSLLHFGHLQPVR